MTFLRPVFLPLRLCALTSLLTVAGARTHAATTYWDPGAAHGTGSGGTGSWNTTATNKVWSDGASTDNAWVNGNLATFGGTGGLVTVDGAVTAAGITFTGAGYLLSGSSVITLAANLIVSVGGASEEIDTDLNLTAPQTWSVAAASTLTLNGSVTATPTASVAVTGGGILDIFSTDFSVAKFTVAGGTTVNWGGNATLPSTGIYTGVGDGTAGTLNMNTGSITTAAAVVLGNNAAGTMTISDGQFTMTGNQGLFLGDGTANNGSGTGVLNVTGIGRFTTGTTTGNFFLGNAGSGTGTVNLDGGVLSTNRTITRSSLVNGAATGSGTFNFNGGTLQATGSSLAMTGLSRANVRGGGAIFDTNGFDITIAQSLLHSSIAGDFAIDGGLTKNGSGKLTLTGANTYTGPTTVNSGTLLVTGTITGTSRMDIYGTLGGAGIITTASGAAAEVVVADGGQIAPGNNGAGTLTIRLTGSNLNISAAVTNGNSGALIFELAAPNASDRVTLSGGPLIIGSGFLSFDDFNFTNLAGFDPAGTYTLIAGSLPISGTLSDNTIGTVGGAPFQLQLADNNTDLVLVSIPEPASGALLLAGLAGLAKRRQRRHVRKYSVFSIQ